VLASGLWAVLLSPLGSYGTLTVMILAHIVRAFRSRTRIMGSSMIKQTRAGGGRPRSQGVVAVHLTANLACPGEKRLPGGLGWIQFTAVVSRHGDGRVPLRGQVDGVPKPSGDSGPTGAGRGGGAALMLTGVVLCGVGLVQDGS